MGTEDFGSNIDGLTEDIEEVRSYIARSGTTIQQAHARRAFDRLLADHARLKAEVERLTTYACEKYGNPDWRLLDDTEGQLSQLDNALAGLSPKAEPVGPVAGLVEEARGPHWPLSSFDARDWAQAFCERFPGHDEGLMISWFANALMRGYDERAAALEAERGLADELAASLSVFARPDVAARALARWEAARHD